MVLNQNKIIFVRCDSIFDAFIHQINLNQFVIIIDGVDLKTVVKIEQAKTLKKHVIDCIDKNRDNDKFNTILITSIMKELEENPELREVKEEFISVLVKVSDEEQWYTSINKVCLHTLKLYFEKLLSDSNEIFVTNISLTCLQSIFDCTVKIYEKNSLIVTEMRGKNKEIFLLLKINGFYHSIKKITNEEKEDQDPDISLKSAQNEINSITEEDLLETIINYSKTLENRGKYKFIIIFFKFYFSNF